MANALARPDCRKQGYHLYDTITLLNKNVELLSRKRNMEATESVFNINIISTKFLNEPFLPRIIILVTN